MHRIGEITPENGGYRYSIEGPNPSSCWSRDKPDMKRLEKTIKRLNMVPTRGFNNSKKDNEAKL